MQVINSDGYENISIRPIVSFKRSISGQKHKVDLYTIKKEHLVLLKNQSTDFISPDELNPRIQSRYNAISNADLDAQIIKHGQVTPAIGRYITDGKGEIKYSKDGYPIIGILDGSRRFDCCTRNDKDYTIEVGRFDQETSASIVGACVDSQQDLSSLELGILISELEVKHGRSLKEKEIKELLPYEKSKFAISNARKAQRLYSEYPTIFEVFPVISLVGKTTISKLDNIISWANDNFQIETLLNFCKSDIFDYDVEHEDPLFTFDDLQNFDAKSNNIILAAMSERLGIPAPAPKRKVLTDISDYVGYELKPNDRSVPKTEKLVVIEAELTDEERHITEAFFRTLHDPMVQKGSKDITLFRRFEMLFRQLT
jgi:hypothetical protein